MKQHHDDNNWDGHILTHHFAFSACTDLFSIVPECFNQHLSLKAHTRRCSVNGAIVMRFALHHAGM